jgi:hypothetical protein
MAERHWNSELPPSTPELDKIILACRTPDEMRSKVLSYWAERGVIAGGDEYAPIFTPQPQTFSREVTFRNGSRCRIEGARSIDELNAMERTLREQRDK